MLSLMYYLIMNYTTFIIRDKEIDDGNLPVQIFGIIVSLNIASNYSTIIAINPAI